MRLPGRWTWRPLPTLGNPISPFKPGTPGTAAPLNKAPGLRALKMPHDRLVRNRPWAKGCKRSRGPLYLWPGNTYCSRPSVDPFWVRMTLFQTNSNQTPRAAAWLGVAAVLFGVWLAPACAFICAKAAASESSDHCHRSPRPSTSSQSADHDCPSSSTCLNLQVGLQSNHQPEIVTPSTVCIHSLPDFEQAVPHETGPRRLFMIALGIGPPVPPPLFTVLRA